MRVAITSQGRDLDSPIDPRFGRAKWFLIVDSETREVEPVDNAQNLEAAQGAGIQAARTVVNSGVGAVITGHCGPKAFRTLQAAGVEVVVGAEGTVAEALEKYESGELRSAERADVEGHWV